MSAKGALFSLNDELLLFGKIGIFGQITNQISKKLYYREGVWENSARKNKHKKAVFPRFGNTAFWVLFVVSKGDF